MGILAQCPNCRNRQSARNKVCKCGQDLDKAKRGQRVKYWIIYRMPDGKQRKEYVGSFEELNGYSIEDARTAESKRKTQKKENRLLDIKLDSKLTFGELTKWYLKLSSVKALASFRSVSIYLNNFNKVYGKKAVGTIKPLDLEELQTKRKKQGLKPASIDLEIALVKTMVTKAFDNDLLDGNSLKAFRRIKRMIKRGANARKRIISFEEYLGLIDSATSHFRPVLITAYHTGMRSGELQKLQWSHIDREKGFIRLPAEITKERREKNIPINHHVKSVLAALPRSINHDFVFTYKGKPFTHKNGFVHSFKGTCEKAGLPYGRNTQNGMTLHDVRGTVKTNMLSAGMDKVYRDLILGHSLTGMDVHYLAPTEETLKNEMVKFTQWLDDCLGSTFANVTQTLPKTG
jgi:integrase